MSTASKTAGLAERPAASLSPSRAGDYTTCPLLYRFRSIDKLPERPGEAAARGTLVHAVLEKLFDEPPENRSLATATALLEPNWQTMLSEESELPALLFGPDSNWEAHLAGRELDSPDPDRIAEFLNDAERLLATYFQLEDPTVLSPEAREVAVSTTLDSGLTIRGIIDRVDRAPTGQIRIVDYKTGRSPGEGWESKALFQMRFYGLVHWRTTGRIPDRLQLIYLGNKEKLIEDPTEQTLQSTQNKIEAIWKSVEQSIATGQWESRKSKLCDWCSFKNLCPEWGGTPPPLPTSDKRAIKLTETEHKFEGSTASTVTPS